MKKLEYKKIFNNYRLTYFINLIIKKKFLIINFVNKNLDA